MAETKIWNGRQFEVEIREVTDGQRPLWIGYAKVVGRDSRTGDSFTTDACLSAAEADEKIQRWMIRWRP